MEDEPSIRLMTTRILRREGYTVLEAANGDEALQVATAHARQTIHLLLSDLVMTVGDAGQAYSSFRSPLHLPPLFSRS